MLFYQISRLQTKVQKLFVSLVLLSFSHAAYSADIPTQVGSLAGATVKLYSLATDGSKTLLTTETTLSGLSFDEIGVFTSNIEALDNDTFYLYEITGGSDQDANIDGVVDITATINQGIYHSIAKGSVLKAQAELNLTVLNEIVYQLVSPQLINDFTNLQSHIDSAVSSLISSDLTGDGNISESDLYLFEPSTDQSALTFAYQDSIERYNQSVLDGNTILFEQLNYNILRKEVDVSDSIYQQQFDDENNRLYILEEYSMAYFDTTTLTYNQFYFDDNESINSMYLSADKSAVYVCDDFPKFKKISIADGSVEQEIDMTDLLNPGGPPSNVQKIQLNNSEQSAYMATDSGIYQLDIASQTVTEIASETITTASDLVINTAETTLYSFDKNTPELALFNLKNQTYQSISLSDNPQQFLLSSDEQTLYIALGNAGFAIVDTQTQTVSYNTSINYASSINYSDDKSQLIISNYDQSLEKKADIYAYNIANSTTEPLFTNSEYSRDTSDFIESYGYQAMVINGFLYLIDDGYINVVDHKFQAAEIISTQHVVSGSVGNVVLSEDENTLYTDSSAGNIDFMSTADGTFSSKSVGGDIYQLTYNKGKTGLYYTVGDSIYEYDFATVNINFSQYDLVEDAKYDIRALAVGANNKLYIAHENKGFKIFDTLDGSITKVFAVKTSNVIINSAETIAYAALSTSSMGLAIVDLTDNSYITISQDDVSYPQGIVLSKDETKLYVSGSNNMFYTIDLANGNAISSITLSVRANTILLNTSGEYAFLGGSGGFEILNLVTQKSVLISEDSSNDFVFNVAETKAYIGQSSLGVKIIDISQFSSKDTDGDGIFDINDDDDDNDGVLDVKDAFPLDANEYQDLDNDGLGNNTDTDIDGDGVLNDADGYPYDATNTAPDAFDLGLGSSNVELNTIQISGDVIITGMVGPTPISITGGEYSIDGDPEFSSVAATIFAGSTVTVRHTSSFEDYTAVNTVLTIGDVSATFSSTTGDGTPDGFTFVEKTDVDVNSNITHQSVVSINGLTIQSPVSISGGSYQVTGDSGFQTTDGLISDGQSILIRHTSSEEYNQQTDTVLTIGGVTAIFSSTTISCDNLNELTPMSVSESFTEVESNNSICSAVDSAQSSVDHGTVVSGSLDIIGDEDWYFLEVLEQANFEFSTLGCTENGTNTMLEVYDDNLTKLASRNNFNGTSCSEIVMELAEGRYAIRVDLAGETAMSLGDYTLNVKQLYPYRSFESEGHTGIENSAEVVDEYQAGWVGHLGLGDVDTVSINVNAGEYLIVEVTDLQGGGCKNGDLDLNIAVLDSADAVIGFNEASSGVNFCPKVAIPITFSDEYRVMISETVEDTYFISDVLYGLKIDVLTSDAILELEDNDTLNNETIGTSKLAALMPGDIVFGNLSSINDDDYFKVFIPDFASKNGHVIFSQLKGPFHSTITLFNQEFVAVGSDQTSFGGISPTLEKPFDSGGAYLKIAQEGSATEVGNYALTYDLVYSPDITATKTEYNNIPDTPFLDSFALLQSTLAVSDSCFAIDALKVDIDLMHAESSDVEISLTSPNGTNVLLRSAGSTQSLIGSFGVDLTPVESLNTFQGEAITGDWVLSVKDTTPNNVGRLNRWQLNIICTFDTDSDGMPDGYEDDNGLDKNLDDSAEDPDGDGLSNLEEYLLGTNPQDPKPIARAGDDQSVVELSTVYLNGAASSDPVSEAGTSAIVDRVWTQTGGSPMVMLNTETSSTASFFAPDVSEGVTLTFTYTIKDIAGAYDNDSLIVTIKPLDTDSDGIPDDTDTDDDGDGVLDVNDAFPLDATESVDTDGDGIGNNADTDDDGDGVADSADAFPLDSSESVDTDDDGTGNNADTDDDGDGVEDSTDAFPLDSTESVDTDGDGTGNNADTDDDNDGILDINDAFPLDATESVDTDGDGTGNNVDTDDDGDGVEDSADAFPLDDSESVDTDGDGIGNNADKDDDNDGILDGDDIAPLDPSQGDNEAPIFGPIESLIIEASGVESVISLVVPEATDNSLLEVTVVSDLADSLALGEHVITWAATDAQGNQATAEQLVTVVDTTKPEFDYHDDVLMNAQGRLTNISGVVTARAMDIVDGELTAVIVGDSQYQSGSHLVELSVSDNSGNNQRTTVKVDIMPELTIAPSVIVEAGGRYPVSINLSGQAPSYPVAIEYQLSQNGTVIVEASEIITSGTQGQLIINIPNEVLSTDILFINLISTTNAFVDDDNPTEISVIENNEAPRFRVMTTQNGEPVSIIDPANGVVTITTTISDVNQNDSHDINWVVADNAFVDESNDESDLIFEFDPSGLGEEGKATAYNINIDVVENNTDDSLSVNRTVQLLVETLAALDDNTDSDGDGISDSDEGYTDSDGDGIADYLDDDSNTTRLPTTMGSEPMQTAPGLIMSLGTQASASGGASSTGASLSLDELASTVPVGSADTNDNHFSATSSVFNFVVSGLAQQGDSVAVVIPLASGTSLPANAAYRKYNTTNGWYTFVEDENNSTRSAKADVNGNCPTANDALYMTGLTQGDNCIQLTIEDGGPNDADLTVNGKVEDPGVFVLEAQNQAPSIIMATSYQVDETTELILDASSTIDVEDDDLMYVWQQLTGTEVNLTITDESTLTFISPEVQFDESISFKLTVSDGRDESIAVIEVLINQINQTPSITIDTHQNSYEEGTTVKLTSQSSDPDDDMLTYIWTQLSGTDISFSDTNESEFSFTLPQVSVDEVIEIQLTVSDGSISTSTTTTLTITNVVEVITITPPKKSSGGSSSTICLIMLLSLFRLRKSAMVKVAA